MPPARRAALRRSTASLRRAPDLPIGSTLGSAVEHKARKKSDIGRALFDKALMRP
jgi:hypothetical protein